MGNQTTLPQPEPNVLGNKVNCKGDTSREPEVARGQCQLSKLTLDTCRQEGQGGGRSSSGTLQAPLQVYPTKWEQDEQLYRTSPRHCCTDNLARTGDNFFQEFASRHLLTLQRHPYPGQLKHTVTLRNPWIAYFGWPQRVGPNDQFHSAQFPYDLRTGIKRKFYTDTGWSGY